MYGDLELAMRVHAGAAMGLAKGLRQKGVCAPAASIVFLSSAMGLAGKAGLAVYASAKAALIGLSRSLAVELARDGIRVNCISPAFVDTPMIAGLRDALTPEQMQQLESSHLLGLGTPQDIANAVAFLVGDTGRWITGSNLIVDGGYTAV
jgi:NAD(P)-dependent dehydrogenase (short-subunit alcohol dehydrogenase family)